MDMLHVQFLELRQEIVGQCLSSLMPRQVVLLLVIHHRNQEIFQQGQFILLELAQRIEHLMRQQDGFREMWVGLDKLEDGRICVDVFELEDSLVAKANLFLRVDQLVVEEQLLVLHSTIL